MEVFPESRSAHRPAQGLLHVRGGVSNRTASINSCARSSPRPWRCFSKKAIIPVGTAVFSTSVEVFLYAERSRDPEKGLLHVRGGVSGKINAAQAFGSSSPRPWRCFCSPIAIAKMGYVFSTSVEVFPSSIGSSKLIQGLLHVRGGVSLNQELPILRDLSSPRPWRCFQAQQGTLDNVLVFSTSVEVFPTRSCGRA